MSRPRAAVNCFADILATSEETMVCQTRPNCLKPGFALGLAYWKESPALRLVIEPELYRLAPFHVLAAGTL
ncbi:hypothetical protein E4U22_000822 [Claviceps purpurea]|nr:hypothetical protein E4U22_000822 [Claviceps purpurea]